MSWGGSYESIKSKIFNVYVSIRDRELNNDRKLKERADRLEIKSHELVQLKSHKHLVRANYLKAISMLGYVALGAFFLHERNNSLRTVVYRAYPWSGQKVISNYRCTFSET